ncbi:MAG: putative CtpA-like serine protease [Bacteroidetes bacterium ADurb.Bin035]|jgi:carboxyl-terminal processing protease|nr:S41 family peptidase [Bacteroidales bacterium]OQC47596.1 MAG: putative CtpA-like serine protease [Bacteroidetes bacterium ADurb.Bin035]HNQ20419.1 S41 family peptidase [Bacteroidales bacterium]HOH93638.1 S41 family peptidase [Bacteroidales bacterium]HON97567.1 S41 family peptidase [Bacteroidales bacterium]
MKKIKNILKIIIFVIIGIFSFRAVVGDISFELVKNLDIFTSVMQELNKNYVDEIQPGSLTKTAIDEMLKSLDPYTEFIPESDIEDYKLMTTGQYGGVGALIQKLDSFVVVSEPYEGFPAYNAGLRAGDIILEINGVSVKGKSTQEVSDMLKGAPDTDVEITFKNIFDDNIKKVKLTRKEIKLPEVPYYGIVAPHIGYISLSSFTMNCSNTVKDALLKLKENDPKLQGLILDLRNNGGGLLNEAVNIINIFVPKNTEVVSTKGRLPEANRVYKTMQAPVDLEIPLCVLINENSASASEIVAGALQDLDRAVIIGEQSYGKGLVQNIVNLPYNSKLKVTIAKYYIPSGRCIQKIDYSDKTNGVGRQISADEQKIFFTKNKRPVKDAGGILPDIDVKIDSISAFTAALYVGQHIFKFATLYSIKHPTIPQPDQFKLSDADYNEFIAYMKDKEIKYSSPLKMELDKLTKLAEDEKKLDLIKDDIELLKKKITLDNQEELIHYKDEITTILAPEIISRYYYQKGRIQYELQNDNFTHKAVEILTNPSQYNNILSVK